MNDDRVRPFWCGSQAADWLARNCERCAKGVKPSTCEIDKALGEAFWDGNGVSREIGKRMGALDVPCNQLTWDCPERVPAVREG